MPEIRRAKPPYAQIADDLRQKIINGEFKVGDVLPSARQLAVDWGVAAGTAARAMTELRRAGLTAVHPGTGTVVRERARNSASRVDFYDDPHAPTPNSIVPSVTAYVVRAGKLLLVHKVDNGRWALPGGGIDPGESAPAAARRETLEETGIEIQVDGLVGLYTNPRHVMRYDDGEVRQQFSACFRASPTGGDMRAQPSETSEVAWVPLDRISDLNIHPSMRRRINDARQWTPHQPAQIDD